MHATNDVPGVVPALAIPHGSPQVPTESAMKTEVLLFKALADPTRLRIAALLAVRGEVCVCHLAGALDAPEFKVSRHLAVLRSSGVVEARREGTWMHYRLADPRSAIERCVFQGLRRHLESHPTVAADLRRLNKTGCTRR
jgi:ArsR family transcriptional regulator